MKRDIELIRILLINLDAHNNIELSDDKTIYHINLLINAKYAEATKLIDGGITIYNNLNYTEAGYDLLTHISNDTVWRSIQERIERNNMSVNEVPIEVIKELAKDIMMGMFGHE